MRCSTCDSKLLIRLGLLVCIRVGCPGHRYTEPLKEAA